MAQVVERSPLIPQKAVKGVRLMDSSETSLQRKVVLVLTVLPFVGVIAAIWILWGSGLSSTDVGLALAFYLFTGFGVTVGYHRLFTHKSFEASRGLKIALALGGSMAVEGSLIGWCATHRRHHAYSDQAGDPHSPHLDEGPGLKGVVKGLWHAHMGWLMSPEVTDEERWAPDLMKDKDLAKLTRFFPLIAVTSFFLPALLGLAITRSWWGAVTAFVWASLVRIFLLHHVTWSINSICHFYGERPFKCPDFSTNNWVLAIISFGESWHNNHHAFPTSARHGLGRGQIDVSAFLIKMFEKLHLARGMKLVNSKQLEAKKVGRFRPAATVRAAIAARRLPAETTEG
jgi:stearoyl-CoA desaturase (Delta-9 desaturase)